MATDHLFWNIEICELTFEDLSKRDRHERSLNVNVVLPTPIKLARSNNWYPSLGISSGFDILLKADHHDRGQIFLDHHTAKL